MFQSILGHLRSRTDNLRMASFEPKVETKKASFGMGCFWGVEALFGVTEGVIRTKVGYEGGTSINPTYRNIGDHTETVELEFDPNEINYRKLLEIFWENHTPSDRYKRQYMSAIFYHDEEQKKLAEETMKEKQARMGLGRPIVTHVAPHSIFYDAEDYHQKYRLRGHSFLDDSLKLSDAQVKSTHVAARLNGWLSGYGSLAQFEREKDKLGLDEKQIEYMRTQIPKAVRHC